MLTYGLIGKSLDHSWSKEYFINKFLTEKITGCNYENFQLADLKGLRDLILDESNIAGLNITIPFKQEVIQYLDELDLLADSVGAVNCVKISRRGRSVYLKGYNTDMQAFRDTLSSMLNENYRKALVLGDGGAARAVCHALKDLHIEYSIVSRKSKEGFLIYKGLDREVMTSHQIIINATPAGMYPDINRCPPFPYKYLTSTHLLYDLIYNPEETLFLKKGIEAGARVKNGLEMLQLQAELSWQIWQR